MAKGKKQSADGFWHPPNYMGPNTEMTQRNGVPTMGSYSEDASGGTPSGSYYTGTDSMGTNAPMTPSVGSARTQSRSDAPVGRAPTPWQQGRLSPGDENPGARLTVSPSMKLVDPTGYSVPTQANGAVVPSSPDIPSNFWDGVYHDSDQGGANNVRSTV